MCKLSWLTEKQYKDLKNSLSKFDLAEIPAINTDNKILAGHQRLKILSEIKGNDFEIDVRVPNRELTEKEAQEYLIRSNKNTGEFNFDILANEFELDDLIEFGFEDRDFLSSDEVNEMNEWDKNNMPVFELAEKEIKLTVFCKSEDQREQFCKEKNIIPDRTQGNQWSLRL